jgi:hypothetical protein
MRDNCLFFAALAALLAPVSCATLADDCELNLTCKEYGAACGNGVVDPGEECDEGELGSDSEPDACRTTCMKARCGDGVLDSGELCDGPTGVEHLECLPACSLAGCIVGTAPYPTVQSAVDDASCTVIIVSQGTYGENLAIARDVEIIGVGTEPPLLDGGGKGSVVSISSGIVTLRGLVFSGGKAEQGGGIRNEGTLALDGCFVEANTATGAEAKGGGIYNSGGLVLTSSTVTGNQALSGGGIFNAGGAVDLSAADVAENVATAAVGTMLPVNQVAGGGIYTAGGTLVLHDGTTIRKNTAVLVATAANVEPQSPGIDASVKGGGVFAAAASVSLEGSEISENTVDGKLDAPDAQGFEASVTAGGAGLSIEGGQLTLEKSVIAKNVVATAIVTIPAVAVFTSVRSEGGGILASGSTVVLKGSSTVSGNRALASGPAADGGFSSSWDASGGGIAAQAASAVQLEDSSIEDNLAEGQSASGGALILSSSSSLTSRRSVLRANVAHGMAGSALGGAVHASSSTSTDTVVLELEDSTVEHNEARGKDTGGSASGGAFYLRAGTGDAITRLVLRNSTVSENTAVGAALSGGNGNGGAVWGNAGTGDAQVIVWVINSTLSGNAAKGSPAGDGSARAGAIALTTSTGQAKAMLVLRSATITANRAEAPSAQAGGIYLDGNGQNGSSTTSSVANSIVADNLAVSASDCLATDNAQLTSEGYNLFGSIGSCPIAGSKTGVSTGVSPLLSPLADHGGPTWTHALGAGSPAEDTGNPAGCVDEIGAPLANDQRGRPRHNAICDLGAFERQADDP